MLKNIFKKKKKDNQDKYILIAALLIHAARVDENYTEIEKKIITKAIMDLNKFNLDKAEQILKDAEKKRKNQTK